MTIKFSARSGIAALAVAGIAAVSACSSSSSSSSSPAAAASTSASAAASSSAANPLSGGGASGTVVIGSANFPENEVLAEVYALALQKAGVKVAITIIPEYNGTLLSVEVDKASTAKTTADVDAALAAKLPSTLTVLNPAPAQDSDSITVSQATAAKYKLKSIADLKSAASQLVLGGPPEFKTRTDGVVGLK